MRAGLYLALGLMLFLIATTSAYAQYQVPPPSETFVYWNYSLPQTGYVLVYAGGCSPSTMNVYVFTPGEYNAWYSGQSVSAVYAGTLTDGEPLPIQLPAGNYVVVGYPEPSNWQTCFYAISNSAFGMGIVSLPTQPIVTNRVMGYFNISSVSAYNPNAVNYHVPDDGADIQLNVILVVNLANGQTQYYWLIQFLTHSQNYDFLDNVWNYTTHSAPLTTIAGNGAVGNSSSGIYYGYQSSPDTYSLPFAGYLIIDVSRYMNTVVVEFGYAIIQSGPYQPPQVIWYDKVYITPSASIVNVYIEAYSNGVAGTANPLDAELVFAGYANGEPTTFSNTNAELALVYWDGNAWLPFPNVYSFALDTFESATDLQVSMPGSFAQVSVGKPNFGLVNPQPLIPTLPMTFINVVTPVGSSAFYITEPYRVGFLPIIQNGSNIRCVFSGYYLNNDFYSNSSIMIYPSQAWFTTYNIATVYQKQYFININSVFPVSINGTETTNFNNWVNAGSVLGITANNVTMSNETLFVPAFYSETLSINSPITLTINWTPYYYVEVTSNYPINVNGVTTTNYTKWIRSGSQLVITAKPINELGGLIILRPNATSLALTISNPTTITITYTPNYMNLIIVIAAVVIISVAIILFKVRRH